LKLRIILKLKKLPLFCEFFDKKEQKIRQRGNKNITEGVLGHEDSETNLEEWRKR
jgi:hypothetical protein